jgi:uncharacterized membrane protein YidH (DUF202 family)
MVEMKDRHLWFLVFAVGFFCLMIVISFFDREPLDKILLDLYGWTVIVTIGTIVYYAILYFKNRRDVESKEYKKILKIAIIILIGLLVVPAVINFGLGKPLYLSP